MVLRPPVEPMLARARESLPPLGAGSGQMAVQPKFDGFRALIFTPLREGDPVLLQTRGGAFMQDRFPELAAAARGLPAGLVLDGELAVLDHYNQLSFTALQRRATAGRNARALAAEMPAHFIAFDVLQRDGQELLDEPFARRREVLEALFANHRLVPPWTLCPSTTDAVVADEWLHEWTDVPGVEGVVVKSLAGRYRPGVRGWTKVRRRNTTEAIIGGITGSLHRPLVLLLGRYDTAGRLRLVGKTTPLQPGQAQEVADHLTAAGPDHPWTGVRFTASWNSRTPLEPVLVAPALVAEFSADVSQDHGVWRHPLRYERLRLDATEADVPPVGDRQ
ncbi:ATP-dependent DNA ligase [Streptomyces glycanivorans]|uniref:ATP-dependent DNA ligase n=1 Tax=Streptomyces glycanivorans TaxID=3033808 RepID=A0ABY9JN49_9ACTN|nr:ATP-dependent DNA ligase [Streptomyces sp. Alt3]WLQ69171.1 ATP-dependent DNA ligase [Streptomyces sp. Alt3]